MTQVLEIEIGSLEAVAERVAFLGFEGCQEVVDALRGELLPADLAAQTLIAALRDHRVPRDLKCDGGPIRTAIADAWASYNAAQTVQRIETLEAFSQFREELREVSRQKWGYAVGQRIRGAATPFFQTEDGRPALIKALEALIADKNSNEVTQLLVKDRQLAEAVANAPKGRQAGALIGALQERAVKAAHEVAEVDFRRRCNGKFGKRVAINPHRKG